jgi:hypothetical protein
VFRQQKNDKPWRTPSSTSLAPDGAIADMMEGFVVVVVVVVETIQGKETRFPLKTHGAP